MEFRSTNDNGYAHHQGDVISNVSSGGPINSSHGVHLTGGSTGGIVQPAGDEAAIALNIRGKGTGGVILGGPTNSTTPILSMQRYRIDFTVPNLSSNAAAASTLTLAGLTTNSILMMSPRQQTNSTVVGVLIEPRCSTVDELTLTFVNGAVSSLTGSTQSAWLFQLKF